jgi:hypothetical protein
MAAAGSSSRLVSAAAAAAAADGATSSCRSQAETGTDNIYGGVVAAAPAPAPAPAAVAPTCGGKTSWFGLGYGHAVGMCVAGVVAVVLLLQQWGDAIG